MQGAETNFTFTVPGTQLGARMLRAAAVVLEAGLLSKGAGGDAGEDMPQAPKKRGRPKKEEAVKDDGDFGGDEPAEDDTAEDTDDGDGAEESEDASDDEGSDESDEADEKAEDPKKDADKPINKIAADDLVPKFQAYAKKHGNPAAKAILKSVGAKSVREIKRKNFQKVINALKGKRAVK